jgi:hypothetical protein
MCNARAVTIDTDYQILNSVEVYHYLTAGSSSSAGDAAALSLLLLLLTTVPKQADICTRQRSLKLATLLRQCTCEASSHRVNMRSTLRGSLLGCAHTARHMYNTVLAQRVQL